MIKRGLVKKLFMLNTLMVSVFFIGLIIFQNYFFDQLYLETKTQEIETSAKVFSKEYSNQNWSYKTLLEKIELESQKNNISIFIIDDDGNQLSKNENYNKFMMIGDEFGNSYMVNLDSLFEEEYKLLKDNQEISIEGYSYNIENLEIEPTKITSSDGNIIYNEEEIDNPIFQIYGADENEEIIEIDENQEDIIYEDIGSTYSKYDESIENFDSDYEAITENIQINGKIEYKQFKDDFDQNQNYFQTIMGDYLYDSLENPEIYDTKKSQINYYEGNIIVYERIEKNGENLYIYTIASLKSISEAANIMKKYYPYLIGFAGIIILIISFIYSKIVAKPLIEINKVASKMANLDFEIKSEVKSDDEIGNLSESLNRLSTNLNNTMTKLTFANEKLKEDIEKEKKQEQIRKEFVANVSHELKTPLGVIKGFAEGIKDGIFENKKEYYLDIILDEVDGMNELVLEMLDLSKLESGSIDMKIREFDIGNMLDEYSMKMIAAINEKNINLNILKEIQSNLVIGDKKRIAQVVENLISNAIRYTQTNGKINIFIRIDEENKKIKIVIENSCRQIEEAELEKIWDRFYKTDKSRNRLDNGTGIGLSIVKKILELHKSEFGVKTIENGIEFYFDLDQYQNN